MTRMSKKEELIKKILYYIKKGKRYKTLIKTHIF